MGTLEQRSRIRTRKAKVKKAILATLVLAAVGTLNGGMLVRSVMQALAKERKVDRRRLRAIQSSIYIARKRLLQQGLITYEGGLWYVSDKGRAVLRQFENDGYQIKSPRKWDGKWRILIFDIREKRRGLREKIRNTLAAIGFVRLQDSVWVHPFDCEDVLLLLKADFKIGRDLLYIIADEIENDRWLLERFGLLGR